MAEAKVKLISRRDFIKGSGVVVGGAAVGSTVLAVACAPPTTETVEVVREVEVPGPVQQVEVEKVVEVEKEVLREVTREVEVIRQVPLKEVVNLNVNGKVHPLKVKDNWSLAYVLRQELGLTGTKISCDEGICGFCAVIIDNKPVLACQTLAIEMEGKDITTIEGLHNPDATKMGVSTLDPVQQGFVNENGFMCGYCTPATIMVAKAYLAKNPNPSLDDVKLALSGNLCLCGGYELIQKSVLEAARLLRGG
ncbi:MAG: hypothetical protein CL877_02525 [Dehalococcoidales bacterium]|jgi:carbon-monoxide dehydrogenase small subunit|nr:hypothetical protein [Dehalococcoidales bacterium]MDP7310217.1 (2Fe-2S)-binding protein [Dehalococcoidales bacterium]MDP7409209.1 (2Fe-2S)-binding protein [Dehalococcoidales bacterium]MDP7675543.1 (2Fe-2S)-binding protein [Dehalococcoidales bacterium]HJM37061.1 (2Fe-2S)-binding protein [Dehalococcoidales bacterium]